MGVHLTSLVFRGVSVDYDLTQNQVTTDVQTVDDTVKCLCGAESRKLRRLGRLWRIAKWYLTIFQTVKATVIDVYKLTPSRIRNRMETARAGFRCGCLPVAFPHIESFRRGLPLINRSWLITALIVLLSLRVAVAFALPPRSQKISFQEAVQIAIDKSPALNTARIDVDLRDLEYANSYSALLPSLDFNTTYGLRDSRPSIYRNIYGSELNLQLTENLYDNGVSLTKFQSAKIQKDIADLNFRNERDKIVLEVGAEYMRYSLAKSLAEVQEQQFNIINKQYKAVSNQYQQGVKTRRDYLRFKTELRRAEIDLQTSQTNMEKSRVELMRLLGFEMNGKTEPFEFVPIEIQLTAVAAIPTAAPDLSQHFQYRIADLQKKIYENDVYIVKRAYWPELSLTAGASYHTGDYLGSNIGLADNETTSWNALLTLKFNLWDWGVRRRNISIAEVRKSQAENTIAVGLNAFSSDGKKLMLDLQQSSKNFSLARELLDLETTTYNSLDSEYRNGRVSYLDIIVALRDLLSAKVQMYTSYYDLRGQLLKYRYQEGKLYESINGK